MSCGGPFGLGARLLAARKPEQGLLEVVESPDVPAADGAEKSKQVRPVLRVGMTENGPVLPAGEPGFGERVDQLDQVPFAEHGLGAGAQRAQIHEGLVDATLPARASRQRQRRLAGGQVEPPVRIHPDKVGGMNDVKLQRRDLGMLLNGLFALNRELAGCPPEQPAWLIRAAGRVHRDQGGWVGIEGNLGTGFGLTGFDPV